MAAANESQGLKIAVAAFVTLTVILAVTSYFLYSAYSKSEAQLEAAQEKLRTAQKGQSDAVNQYDDFRKIAGVRAEEPDPAKAEVTAYFKKTDERIGNLANAVSGAIKQAQDAGRDCRRAGRRQGQGSDDRHLVSERTEQELHLDSGSAGRVCWKTSRFSPPSFRPITLASGAAWNRPTPTPSNRSTFRPRRRQTTRPISRPSTTSTIPNGSRS